MLELGVWHGPNLGTETSDMQSRVQGILTSHITPRGVFHERIREEETALRAAGRAASHGGLCEFCNRNFQSTYSNPTDAKIDIRAQFNQHVCGRNSRYNYGRSDLHDKY
jgi:hypothetical protein